MTWRLARSIDYLRMEILSKYKGTTFWTIGDTNHRSGYSDHNPNEDGVVCAADILGDGGLNLGAFVHHLVSTPHPNLRYVIHKRKIYERRNNFKAVDYHGKNPHNTHVHVSVGNGPDQRSTSNYDSTDSWGIADLDRPSEPKPSVPSTSWTDRLMSDLPTLKRNSKGPAVKRWQALLNTVGAGLKEDGIFGPNTGRETRDYQRTHDLAVDELVGKHTWTRMLVGK